MYYYVSMSGCSEYIIRKFKNNWRISLIVLSIISIIVLRFTITFKIFIITLVVLLIIIPVILLLTSGFLKDIKFYFLRFEESSNTEHPIVPKLVGVHFQLISGHEEILECHKSALKYEDEEIATKKMRD